MKILYSLMVVVFLCATTSITYADTFLGTRSDGGNVSVFHTLSVRNSPYYTNIYTQARHAWNGISPNVTLNRTYSSENVGTFVFAVDSSTPNLLGYIIPYTKNVNWSIVPNTQGINDTWWRTDVYIIKNNMTAANMNDTQKISNAIHELWHTLKLAHPGQWTEICRAIPAWQWSVMLQGIQSIWPQPYDREDIIAKW